MTDIQRQIEDLQGMHLGEMVILLGRSLDSRDKKGVSQKKTKDYIDIVREFIRKNFPYIRDKICKNLEKLLSIYRNSGKIRAGLAIYDLLGTIYNGVAIALLTAMILEIGIEEFCSMNIDDFLGKIGT